MNRVETTEHLPRIQSQTKVQRIYTATNADRKHSEETTVTNKVFPSVKQLLFHNGRQSSERKTLKSANNSKAVKYQATSAIYIHKIELLEKQSSIIDKEMIQIREQINQIRVKNKMGEESSCAQSQASISTMRGGRAILDGKGFDNKIDAVRKRVDKQNQKNRQIEKEIDIVRKDISTTKKLNQQLQARLKSVNEKYENEHALSILLDDEIGSKNEIVHKKKVENVHKKSHLIKSYDVILKQLDKELQGDKNKKSTDSDLRANDFYLTDAFSNAKSNLNSNNIESSPKLRKIQNQIHLLKSKLAEYDQDFTQLKEKTASEDIEEVTKKFISAYEANFHQYNYINQRYATLEELKTKNIQLTERKNQILKEMSSKKTTRAYAEAVQLKQRLTKVQAKKSEITKQLQRNTNTFEELNKFVINFLKHIPIKQIQEKYHVTHAQNLSGKINESNLMELLQLVLKTKEDLDNYSEQEAKRNKSSLVTSISPHMESSGSHQSYHIEDALESARKDNGGEKDKLLTREELMKAKDIGISMQRKKSNQPKPKK